MRYIITTLLLSVCCFLKAQEWKNFPFESGDILFQELDCGLMCEGLKRTSPAYDGRFFNHAALVYKVGDSLWVIEAYEYNVRLIPLADFLMRNTTGSGNPKVSVARISSELHHLTGRAVGFALEQRGIPFDIELRYDNGRYFSSELIYDAFKAAHYGKTVFDPSPMSFRDPVTGKTDEVWQRYFDADPVKIPENLACISPGALAGDEHIEIIRHFY